MGNLGGDGPDKGMEGIIYKAKGNHMGLDTDNLEVHLHATDEYHSHRSREGRRVVRDSDPEYKPAWVKENGVDGHFASVNIMPGSNVTIRAHAYDKTKNVQLLMDKAAISFFDLDAGTDGKKSIEYVKIGGFDHFFTTNKTEIKIRKMEDGDWLFMATTEGNGDDNPTNPLVLDERQKNRAVSFIFSNLKEAKFEIGATPGESPRVFHFAFRPALRCASTKMSDGTLIAPGSKRSPLTIMEGSARGTGHVLIASLLSRLLFT